MEDIKKDCKFFRQHYGYDNKGKLHDIFCGHCTERARHKHKLACKDCTLYQKDESRAIKTEFLKQSNRIFLNLCELVKCYNQLCDKTKKLTEE